MIFTNNLKLNKNINIPSNDKDFFIFNKHWDYSQKIIFNLDNVNIDNLYVLIQSYLWNSEIKTLRLYTFTENIELNEKLKKNKILSYTNVYQIKKLNLFMFANWWDNISNYDNQYVTETDIYGIIVVFSPQSFKNYADKKKINYNEIYENLKPNYPWKEEIKTLLNAYK